MAVGLIDKYLKNAVRMTVWAADYSWGSLMVTTIRIRTSDINARWSEAAQFRLQFFIAQLKCTQGAGVIDRLEFGDGRSRYESSGEDHEHLVDLEIGMVTRFYQLELKTLKEQIARDMDYKPADQRLGSVGLK